MEPGTLVIVDDMQVTHDRLVSYSFARRAHHYFLSVIHLVQNVFDKDPSHRTISLNATYIVLFKNPRDMSQVSLLDKQLYPGGNGLLTAAYHNPTSSRAHSYVMIYFNQSTPEKFRLRNTLFPEIQIKYGLPYCVTCPSMSTYPGSLNPGTRHSRVPEWWDPGIRTNTGAGDTVLANQS